MTYQQTKGNKNKIILQIFILQRNIIHPFGLMPTSLLVEQILPLLEHGFLSPRLLKVILRFPQLTPRLTINPRLTLLTYSLPVNHRLPQFICILSTFLDNNFQYAYITDSYKQCVNLSL